MAGLFHSAWVKVRRARKHIGDIGPIFAATSIHQDDFLRAASAMGLPIGNASFVSELEIPKDALDEIACCVGDAVHNLRSALDLLACEVVELSPGGNSNGVHFPFSPTEECLCPVQATKSEPRMDML